RWWQSTGRPPDFPLSLRLDEAGRPAEALGRVALLRARRGVPLGVLAHEHDPVGAVEAGVVGSVDHARGDRLARGVAGPGGGRGHADPAPGSARQGPEGGKRRREPPARRAPVVAAHERTAAEAYLLARLRQLAAARALGAPVRDDRRREAAEGGWRGRRCGP